MVKFCNLKKQYVFHDIKQNKNSKQKSKLWNEMKTFWAVFDADLGNCDVL